MLLSAPHRRLNCSRFFPPGEVSNSTVYRHSALKQRRPTGANALARWRRWRLAWIGAAAACVALLGFSLPARASLGGSVGSVESDRAQMNASIQVMQHDAYAVHEILEPGGTVVDEYVTPGGQVFAVSWHGEFPPPMQQILGTYFQLYTAALQAQPKIYGHRPLNIQQPGLVVQTAGHMRSHSGRAYIPSLIPQGVNINQIQ